VLVLVVIIPAWGTRPLTASHGCHGTGAAARSKKGAPWRYLPRKWLQVGYRKNLSGEPEGER
jgi:hypothetical protein